jgi:putative ABC transport system permease protein
VFAAIVAESAAISAIGAACGFVVYFGVMVFAAHKVLVETGVVVEIFKLTPGFTIAFGLIHVPMEVIVPVVMTLLGALCGLVPAFKAYKTDVASNLVPNS